MASSDPIAKRWLYGPTVDLLLGCGGLYLLGFLLIAFTGTEAQSAKPTYLIALLTLAVSMPHYGATLVRVYERRVDRRGYAIFSIWTTVALLVLFALSLNWIVLGSLMLTIYLTWSPWHYTGQNYGIAVMFLGRRGAVPSPVAKRLLYLSFVSSYLLVFVLYHSTGSPTNYGQLSVAATFYRFLPLGIPYFVTQLLFYAFGAIYVFTLIGAFAMLRRSGASWRALGPAALMSFTQAIWFAIPYALTTHGVATRIAPIDDYFTFRDYAFWIALGHAVQYLWVASYYGRNSPAWHGYSQYFGKALASGVAVWTLPVVLFAPDLFGTSTYNAGLGIMVASFVNIHHFILDGAIWKLRNRRIASILIRPTGAEAAEVVERSSWIRRGVWLAAAAGLAMAVLVFSDRTFRYPQLLASRDYVSASELLDRMAWLGRDSVANRRELAAAAARSGDVPLALRQYERILALQPSAQAFVEYGTLYRIQKSWPEALAAFEKGLGENPGCVSCLFGVGAVSIELGDLDRAIATLNEVLAKRPGDPPTLEQLARARDLLAAEEAGSPSVDAADRIPES